MDMLADRIVDFLFVAVAVWYTHRITSRTTGIEHVKAALDHSAQVIRQQGQLLGEYAKILDTLRDHRDRILDTVAHAVGSATAQGLRDRNAVPSNGQMHDEPEDEDDIESRRMGINVS